MNRTLFSRPRAASTIRLLGASALLAGSVACLETGPSAPPVVEGAQGQRGERPDTDPQPNVDGPFLRVTGLGGAEAHSDDGLLQLEVRVGRLDSLRTLGFDVTVEGADVIEWERDDAFLRSSGGKLVALESRLDGSKLSVVVGTTAPVSTEQEDGERVLTLSLAPTSDEVRVSLDTSGDMRGLLDASGARLDVTTTNALVAIEGE